VWVRPCQHQVAIRARRVNDTSLKKYFCGKASPLKNLHLQAEPERCPGEMTKETLFTWVSRATVFMGQIFLTSQCTWHTYEHIRYLFYTFTLHKSLVR
jgi:hypothetical protein